MNKLDKSKVIAQLNDTFRQNFVGGTVCITDGLQALGQDFIQKALGAVRSFDRFETENDPYGEHDFGAFDLDGHKLFWKIDMYDLSMQYGSEDPADPNQTRRVLTVMLAEEY